MISCGETEQFVPFGVEYLKNHPVDVGLSSSNFVSYDSFPEELENESLSKHWWTLRRSQDGLTEEELFFSNKTVVWSRGQSGNGGTKSIIKSMTCEKKILQALFVTFYTYPDLPSFIIEDFQDVPTGSPIPSICIVEKDCLNIFTEDGDNFVVALPFLVSDVWAMKFGLLLERRVSSEETSISEDSNESRPTLYSILHPLDEISPVLYKPGILPTSNANYVKDCNQSFVLCNIEPSISILHCNSTSSLKICKIRRVRQEENENLLQSGYGGVSLTPLSSLLSAPSSAIHSPNVLSHSHTPSSIQAPARPGRLSLLGQTPHTPQGIRSGLSRTYSPSMLNHMRLGLTPSPYRIQTPKVNEHSILNESFVEPEPLIPDICLDLLWKTSSMSRPTKAFLTEDAISQKYISILYTHLSCLNLYKYELTNDKCSLIMGSEIAIQARDAITVERLKMMIVVDGANMLMLYSGPVMVCRLHLAGISTFTSALFKDFSSLNISSKFLSPSTSIIDTPIRRSSLLTSSRPASALEIKFEAGLSPVSTERSFLDEKFMDDPSLPLSSSIIGLSDNVGMKITIQHMSGTFYRATLPSMFCSTIVEKTFNALKYTLPRDLGLNLVNKWYSSRNTPGNGDFTAQTEWQLFSKTVLSMIGYDVEKLPRHGRLDLSGSTSPLIASKKFRPAQSGSENDWDYLLSSVYHQTLGESWGDVLDMEHLGVVQDVLPLTEGRINTSGPLFGFLPTILYTLHLVYEEFKMNTLHWEFCSMMIPCLTQLAADMNAELYLHNYWKDFPTECSLQGPVMQLTSDNVGKLSVPSYFTNDPPNLYSQLQTMMNGSEITAFPYIPSVCTLTKKLILIYGVAVTNCSIEKIPYNKFLRRICPLGQKDQNISNISVEESNICIQATIAQTVNEKIVILSDQLGLTQDSIKVLSPGVSFLLMNAQHLCRTFPPQDWPASAFQLIQRPDLVGQRREAEIHAKLVEKRRRGRIGARTKDPYNTRVRAQKEEDFEVDYNIKDEKVKEEDDGMDSLDYGMLNLRWPKDQRINEVRKMLCSSRPVTINITQRPEVSDHDFPEEQGRHLYALCIRTMSAPLGRGMFTLCTHTPIITEALPIPPLNLKGRAPPRGTTIDFPSNEVPADLDMWPLFHNGVAAGLKIAPNCGDITSTWIIYNKSKGDSMSMSHAGFLMALGLNGHLRNLATTSLHDYLSQGHELTCVGLLLGIAAAMQGTMDLQTTKALSIHLECLLPPTSIELDVPHTVQVAAILSLGLVYADTAHRHMSEVLLREIGRPAGPEMENSTDRESYSLAAGLGLGLVMFGKGGESAGLSDLNLAGALHHYIEGGNKRQLVGAMREKYKSPSYQIKEGDRVNINVTSPGATLALGMIYFASGNKAIADWMRVPSTPYLLDQVRPDFLLLRTIARGLILWDDVMPNYNWVEGHVPTTILNHVHRSGNQSVHGIDYESIHQAYYNVIAGACFTLGLKFAGSANNEAFHVLWKYTRMFTNFTKRSIAELAGKSTIETCLSAILVSLALVMAGTGDLEVLRLIRFLRSRVGTGYSSVGYGSHSAIHMALGFLFLGGGRFSIGTSPKAVAALIISCFPKFPTHSNDNRYHLQALRHLYVLAIEPRLLLSVDVDSGRLCTSKVLIKFKETKLTKAKEYLLTAPLMLPELSKLDEIVIEGELDNARYWPVKFCSGNKSWKVFEDLLHCGSGLFLKLKEGRQPYKEIDSEDNLSVGLNRRVVQWMMKPTVLKESIGNSSKFIQSLVGEEYLSILDDSKCSNMKLGKEELVFHTLNFFIYDCLSVGKPEAINNWINILQALRKISKLSHLSTLLIWQIKLLQTSCCFMHRLAQPELSNENKSDVSVENSLKFAMTTPANGKLGINPCVPEISITPLSKNIVNETELIRSKSNLNIASTSMQAEVPVAMEVDEDSDSDTYVVKPLVMPEQAFSLAKRLHTLIDEWEQDVKDEINMYVKGETAREFSAKCAYTLLLKDIPPSAKLPSVKGHPLDILKQLSDSSLLDLSALTFSKRYIQS